MPALLPRRLALAALAVAVAFGAAGAADACTVPGSKNTIAANVVNLSNQRRANNGRAAVAANAKLTAAAQKHACWMADRATLSHTGANGSSNGDRVRAEGYSFAFVAENLAMGQSTAAAVVAAWMASPTHKANLLDSRAKQIGIGLAEAGNARWWVMVVGAPL